MTTDAVYAVATSVEESITAVRVAGGLAEAIGVPVTLIHFQPVSYALPVDEPGAVSPLETAECLDKLRQQGFDLRIRVCLCRDPKQAIPMTFKPHSFIVLAGRRGWWPNASTRLWKLLEAAGHYVLFVDEMRQGNAHA